MVVLACQDLIDIVRIPTTITKKVSALSKSIPRHKISWLRRVFLRWTLEGRSSQVWANELVADVCEIYDQQAMVIDKGGEQMKLRYGARERLLFKKLALIANAYFFRYSGNLVAGSLDFSVDYDESVQTIKIRIDPVKDGLHMNLCKVVWTSGHVPDCAPVGHDTETEPVFVPFSEVPAVFLKLLEKSRNLRREFKASGIINGA